jgi:hypothetical protein
MQKFFQVDDPEQTSVSPWVWIALAAVFVALRVCFAGCYHPAFNSDEALADEYARSAGLTSFDRDFIQSWRPIIGLRFWWLRFWENIPMIRFPYQAVLAATLLSLTATAAWVAFVWKRVSRTGGLWMAFTLAVAPCSCLYYSTLNERRLETILVAAFLALGAGKWFLNSGRVLGLGLLTAWGFFSEPFILFFLAPVLIYEGGLREWKIKGPFLKCACFGVVGLLLGSWLGIFCEHQWPSFPKGYFQLGWAGFSRLSMNGIVLTRAFPQYWQGNCPFGWLQNTSLGAACDPPLGGSWSILLAVWTFLTFGFSMWGFVRWERGEKETRGFLWILAIPAFFLLLFFLFSHQTWSVPSLRYLNYWMIPWAAGFGLSIAWIGRKHPKWAWTVAILWIGLHAALWIVKTNRMTGDRPGARIARELEKQGLRFGYANYWVSEVVRCESQDRVCLLPYNGEIVRRSIYRKVWSSPVMGIVDVQGLDSPEDIRSSIEQLMGCGYVPIRRISFENDWSVIEFEKKTGK